MARKKVSPGKRGKTSCARYRYISWDHRCQRISEWAAELGVLPQRIQYLIRTGRDPAKVIGALLGEIDMPPASVAKSIYKSPALRKRERAEAEAAAAGKKRRNYVHEPRKTNGDITRRCKYWATLNGVTRPLADWARITGKNYETLRSRFLRGGLTIEDAITEPVRDRPGPPRGWKKRKERLKRLQAIREEAAAMEDEIDG